MQDAFPWARQASFSTHTLASLRELNHRFLDLAAVHSGTPGVLLGFIDGNDARALDDTPAAARKAAALKSYVNYFGQQAANPVQYLDQVWAQEVYTGGCPV